jgi:2-polyprenyl-3-methyl-5-hydroxy-6-metoxy-1,4-benzoquinol methylase
MERFVHTFAETADIETSSSDYAKRFAGSVGAWFLELQSKAVLCMLSELPKASVLDVGGGHGQLTGPLISHGFKVTVLGSANSCSERIKDYLKTGQCEFKIGNVVDLPFPDASFDVVVSFRLLPHVAQWHRLISELSRVARDTVIIDYPTKMSINMITPMLFHLKKKVEGNTREYATFYEKEIIKEFSKSHFQRVDRYAEFFFPMVFHRVLKSPKISNILENMARTVQMTSLFGSPVILKMRRRKG